MKKQCDDCSESDPQTQTFINDQRSGHELVPWSNNEHICGPAKEKKTSGSRN